MGVADRVPYRRGCLLIASIEEERWRELRTRLAGFVGRRVRNPADAEDIVQDVFVRVQRSIDTLSSADRLDAWAFRIARNSISDHYRVPYRREVPSGGASETIDRLRADSVEGEAPNDARVRMSCCIAPMVRQLPDAYREAIELTELKGLTHGAAAHRLGLSVSGTKSRVQRGRARLKEMLLRCCEIETDRRGRVVAFETRSEESCATCADGQRRPVRVAVEHPDKQRHAGD